MTTIKTSRVATAMQVASLYVGIMATAALLTVRSGLQHRIDVGRADAERGEISSTTVLIALLVGLAVAVGGIIVAKVTAEANNIDAG